MLRYATKSDLPFILDIYNEEIKHSTVVYSYDEETLEEKLLWFDNKTKKNLPIIVYTESDQLVGYASYGSFRNWPAYQYSCEHSIYVKKGFRKCGIGEILLEKIITIAWEQGYKTIIGCIDESNIPSINLHKKLNFEYCGTIKNVGYKFDKWLNIVFYQLTNV